VPAIIAIGIAAALKIAISPAILNQAATPAMARAVIKVNIPNNMQLFIGNFTMN
jgi:DNA-binding transcriptional regulator YdaS (Cro superfamily)